VNLVSEQFLMWHRRVAKWEAELGLAVEEPVAPPVPKKKGKATNAGKQSVEKSATSQTEADGVPVSE